MFGAGIQTDKVATLSSKAPGADTWEVPNKVQNEPAGDQQKWAASFGQVLVT